MPPNHLVHGRRGQGSPTRVVPRPQCTWGLKAGAHHTWGHAASLSREAEDRGPPHTWGPLIHTAYGAKKKSPMTPRADCVHTTHSGQGEDSPTHTGGMRLQPQYRYTVLLPWQPIPNSPTPAPRQPLPRPLNCWGVFSSWPCLRAHSLGCRGQILMEVSGGKRSGQMMSGVREQGWPGLDGRGPGDGVQGSRTGTQTQRNHSSAGGKRRGL